MFIQDTFSLKQTKKLDLISKIYVWSVVFETLLFFVLVSQDVSLVGGNLSRILQFVVIVSLILKTSFIPLSEIRIFNPLSYNFKWYFIYFFFILVSLIYGYFQEHTKVRQIIFLRTFLDRDSSTSFHYTILYILQFCLYFF